MANTPTHLSPSKTVPVYRADHFRAIYGANEGDGLSFAADLVLDDVYALSPQAQTVSLGLARRGDAYVIAAGSQVGREGAQIHLDCAATLMGYGTTVVELLVLVEVDRTGHATDVYLLPLAPLTPKTEYRLVGTDIEGAASKLAQVAAVSFTRGTQITLGCGRQRKVEDLRPGDEVLTRDDGIQRIRWIGHSTQRAIGAFAPILIKAGTLNNINDLLVSPDHRLFVYQRTDRVGAGRAELLVKARHIVNGTTVTRQEGGFVEYFQLVFDTHQIIYAEGIAAESMMVDDTTASLVDGEVLARLKKLPGSHRDISELDVHQALLNRPDAVEMLRRASRG
ncbi:MAG: Hint domain-containing protein [Roseobacter sp.]|jgi:hypothetical protein